MYLALHGSGQVVSAQLVPPGPPPICIPNRYNAPEGSDGQVNPDQRSSQQEMVCRSGGQPCAPSLRTGNKVEHTPPTDTRLPTAANIQWITWNAVPQTTP